MFIYLAEAMDLPDPDTRADIDRLLKTITGPDRHIHRPATAWYNDPGVVDPRAEQVNRYALKLADLLIARIPTNTRSIGVPMEIEAATARGIPALVWTDRDNSYPLESNPLVETHRYWPYIADRVNTLHKELQTRPQPTDPGSQPIRLVLNNPDAHPPTRGYPDDAGWDLYTVGSHTIPPNGYASIPTTVVGIQLPPGSWGMVTGRSSATRRGLMVQLAVIDTGWRGHLAIWVYNANLEPQNILDGDRIGQIIPTPTLPTHLELGHTAATLTPHPRGGNGFGSTGA